MSKTPPPDGVYSRRSDPKNASLTAGERAINWAKAMTTAWPVILGLIGLLGFTNAERIRTVFKGTLEPVDGIHQPAPANANFEEQVRTSIADIVAELKRQKGKDAQLQSQLQSQDTENYESLQSMIDITRAEVQQIRELVQ